MNIEELVSLAGILGIACMVLCVFVCTLLAKNHAQQGAISRLIATLGLKNEQITRQDAVLRANQETIKYLEDRIQRLSKPHLVNDSQAEKSVHPDDEYPDGWTSEIEAACKELDDINGGIESRDRKLPVSDPSHQPPPDLDVLEATTNAYMSLVNSRADS